MLATLQGTILQMKDIGSCIGFHHETQNQKLKEIQEQNDLIEDANQRNDDENRNNRENSNRSRSRSRNRDNQNE